MDLADYEPLVVPYRWRARRYPYAEARLRASEARYGKPQDPGDDIPPGFCQCGCGQRTGTWTRTSGRDGTVMGQYKRFIRGHAIRAGLGGRPLTPDQAREMGRRSRLARRQAS